MPPCMYIHATHSPATSAPPGNLLELQFPALTHTCEVRNFQRRKRSLSFNFSRYSEAYRIWYPLTHVYTSIRNAEQAETEWFYEDLQHLPELTPKKDVLFIIGGWNAKVGSQEIQEVTGKFGLGVQNEAGEKLTILPNECTGHSKHTLPKAQEKTLHMDITRWSILKLDWLYFLQPNMEKLYTVRKKKKRDRELTVAQIMNCLLQNRLNWRK